MDFSYPDTHNDIKTLTSEIFEDFGNVERLKKLEENNNNGAYFDKILWKKLIETGIHSASLPTTLEGMGMGYDATTIVAEEIGRSMVSVPYIPCIVATALPLLSVLSDKAVLATLQAITKGDSIAVPAFIEPGNEDPTKPNVTIKKDNEKWIINGIKHCVPYAEQANTLLVSGTIIDNQNSKTLWLGLVETNAETIQFSEQKTTATELQYQVTFNQTQAHCIAQGDEAQRIIETSIAMTTVAYCAMAIGVADKMTRISGEYTSQREQFGVAIATFQSVAHRLADCYIDTECLKIITLKAASDVNNGEYLADTLSMAKAWCGDVLHRVSQAAQHVHGGTGIDRDYHLYRYCLWAKQIELTLGNSKTHMAKLADSLENRYLLDNR